MHSIQALRRAAHVYSYRRLHDARRRTNGHAALPPSHRTPDFFRSDDYRALLPRIGLCHPRIRPSPLTTAIAHAPAVPPVSQTRGAWRRADGREPATLQKCFQHASPWKDKSRSLQTVQGTETIRAYSSCYIHIPHIPTKDQRTGAG